MNALLSSAVARCIRLAVVAAIVTSCSESSHSGIPGDCDAERCDQLSDGGNLCVAIRGNGPLISAHFGALARIMEQHGPVAGVAGGSSGSITSFLTESIMHNPLLRDCSPFDETDVGSDRTPCTDAETRARAALLYKSLIGYLGVLAQSNEGLAIETLAEVRRRLGEDDAEATLATAAVDDAVVEAEDRGQAANDPSPGLFAALGALRDILGSADVRGLINGEAVDLVTDVRVWRSIWYGRDIVGALADAAAFRPGDHMMFVRPSVLDFRALARVLGRISSFYVGPLRRTDGDGYGPYFELEASDLARASGGGGDIGLPNLPTPLLSFDDGVRYFLDGCAVAGVGKTWPEVAELPVSVPDTDPRHVQNPPSCGELLRELVGTYRQEMRSPSGLGPQYHSRIDDAIGAPGGAATAFTVLATTGVIHSPEGLAAWRAARDAYGRRELTSPEGWPIDFERDIGIGYWGTADVLAAAAQGITAHSDLKSRLFTALGQGTWLEILSSSPAEPGLARGVELAEFGGRDVISVGGWSDAHPTLVLDATNAGGRSRCDEVIYVTKSGEEGSFARGVQTQLGGAHLLDVFYDLSREDSSFRRSIEAADTVLCTDWDNIPASEPEAVFENAYRGASLIRRGDVVSGPSAREQLVGCVPDAL